MQPMALWLPLPSILLEMLIILLDSYQLRRKPWQSSFLRLHELLSIGSSCLGCKFAYLVKFRYFCTNQFHLSNGLLNSFMSELAHLCVSNGFMVYFCTNQFCVSTN